MEGMSSLNVRRNEAQTGNKGREERGGCVTDMGKEFWLACNSRRVRIVRKE